MREKVTTWLELAGLLFIVAALGVFLWPHSPAGALAACGASLIAVSLLVSLRAPKPRSRGDEVG